MLRLRLWRVWRVQYCSNNPKSLKWEGEGGGGNCELRVGASNKNRRGVSGDPVNMYTVKRGDFSSL
jgi:hypothetical protein